MKKLFLLLVLAYPLISVAQHDDIYFVPKKEKKTVVESKARDNSFVGLDDVEQSVYEDVDEVYTTSESFDYSDDDFRYSTRIVRFRSPHTLVGSTFYWDLTYNSGINDWMVYDDGYYLDIYPTYSNPVYYYPRRSHYWWGWDNWYHHDFCWSHNYWHYNHCYPTYHWNMHHHHHGAYFPPYFAHGSWKPSHKVHRDIPVNGGSRRVSNVSTSNRRNNENGTVRGSGRPAVNQKTARPTNRVSSNSSGDRTNTVNRSDNVRSSAVDRSQQPRRASNGTVTDRNSSGKATNVRASGNRERVSGSSAPTSNRSTYRNNSSSSSSSSREYNRTNSSGVSRQRTSSSGAGSVSGGARSGSSRSGSNSGSRSSSSRR